MDQVGPSNQPIDRILLFREGKELVVFAEKMNAVFGMAWYEGALYVMNMPRLTVLRDTDGDGKADRRQDLFYTDIGLWPTGLNDHIPSGLQFGIDGYLYISTRQGWRRPPDAMAGPCSSRGVGFSAAGPTAPASRFIPRAPATTSSPTSNT